MQKLIFIIILLAVLLITACGAAPAAETPPDALTHIDLGVGFAPNVQFAPIYVAQTKGFYAEAGLDVSLEHGYENDFIALTAQGERQFAVASGDQIILARSQGLPVVYVMKWYQRFPVGVAAPADSGIDSPQALAGQSVGIPGLFGASYVAWKALVYAANLDESAIDLQEIGFTQAEALSQGVVDAAVVYVANEPIQLKHAGMAVNLIEVSDYIDLVANGLITSEELIRENPDLIRRMVGASLKGLAYTIEHPDEAFDIARQFIPEMSDEDAPTQRAVLNASIELWRSDEPGLSAPEAWADSAAFMRASGLIETDVEVDKLYTNEFVKE
ncbi:MAG TPA: ABC transporter substrate-binding protein [Chloroflexi bacterium]|nr:ABC transporter substrate-binding protein [Chloroflexota bacterium]